MEEELVQRNIYGLLAGFTQPEPLLAAARRAREAGYRVMDAYTPFPVEGLAEAVGLPRTRIQAIILIAGICGGVGAFIMQYYSAVYHYPINIGGRPLNSWPAFVPLMFELTVLSAALTALIAMVLLNGLPRPHHPLFGNTHFDRASRDRFFLCISAEDPRFDREATREFLESLGAESVSEVALGEGEEV